MSRVCVWCVYTSAEWNFGGWKDKSWTKAFVFWTRSNISLSACHTLILYLLSGHMCEVRCESLPTVEVLVFFLPFSFKDRFQVCLSFNAMLTRFASISSSLWKVNETKFWHSICWKFVKMFCHYFSLIIYSTPNTSSL